MDFIHLRTHTEFSVVDGTLRVDDMVAAAAKDGQGALAITDLSNLFGAVKFYSQARKKGVKPILGADIWLESETGEKQRYVIVGEHEADIKRGRISIGAPVARALIGKEVGETVTVQSPKGKREYEKRQTIREREDKREAERAMRSRNRLGE